jgi:carbamoyltransferase
MRKPVYVIGTGLSHDGSVCLLRDGVVVMAIEKERLTRVKHDGGNDRTAMRYVLDRAGITLDDVALVVQNENFGMFAWGNERYGGEPRLDLGSTEVVTISHHLAHAWSAYGGSPFDEAAVLVVDGCGNAYEDCLDKGPNLAEKEIPPGLEHLFFEKDSYYSGQGNTLTAVAKDFSPWGVQGRAFSPPTTLHSIGGVYRAFSQYAFGGFDDSGKLMGLAPYGKLGRFEEPIFDVKDGRVFTNRAAIEAYRDPARSTTDLKDKFQYYADVARWVQHEVERALLHLVQDRYERHPSANLAYAGGVALNAVANRLILRDSKFDRMYIQPAAGDNGLALGCAYYGWMRVLGREKTPHDGTPYLGAAYPSKAKTEDVVERAADLLAEGKVVGWFRGGAEFGPRALGHRSILAHPGIEGLRDHINRTIKRREDFRPFAPSVIAEEADTYFDTGGHDSPYMILVFDVKDEWRERLVNVVHEDGTSRVQTVTERSEPDYHRLLRAFQARTGLPILLNTSLNRRRMPIVETPEEAEEFFRDSGMDAIVIDDVLLVRE